MSWSRNSLVVLALAGCATAAAADTLVVRSSGPSSAQYPAGKSLAPTASISLKPGDQLTLLDGRGTRVLRGPGTFPAAQAAGAANAGARFSALVGGSDRRVRIGAVRGVGGTNHSPNLWYVNVSLGGPTCLADASGVTLWRPRMDQDDTLTIKAPKTPAATVAWHAGQQTAPWPAGVPIRAGEYKLTLGAGPATTVRFVLLGMTPAGLEDTTAALIRSGCQNQLDTIVDTLAVPAGDGGTGG